MCISEEKLIHTYTTNYMYTCMHWSVVLSATFNYGIKESDEVPCA